MEYLGLPGFAVTISNAIIVGLLAAGTEKLAEQLRAQFFSTHNREEWAANIAKYVFGNQFPKQILDIRALLDGETKKMIRYHELAKCLKDYRKFTEKIRNVKYACELLLKDPKSTDALNEAKKPVYDLHIAIHEFCERMSTNGGDPGSPLIDEISAACSNNWKEFAPWRGHIAFSVVESCLLLIDYYNHLIAHTLQITSNKEHMREKLQRSRNSIDLLLEAMEKRMLEMKNGFLKTEPTHSNCKEPECCPFVSLLETIKTSKSHDKLAEKLRKSYSQFEWSVLILEKGRKSKSPCMDTWHYVDPNNEDVCSLVIREDDKCKRRKAPAAQSSIINSEILLSRAPRRPHFCSGPRNKVF